MKKLMKIVETNETPLEGLIGERVTFFCLNYIYAGELIGINESSVCLRNPSIVYETGDFKNDEYPDEQSLCTDEFFIAMNCIESFGKLK